VGTEGEGAVSGRNLPPPQRFPLKGNPFFHIHREENIFGRTLKRAPPFSSISVATRSRVHRLEAGATPSLASSVSPVSEAPAEAAKTVSKITRTYRYYDMIMAGFVTVLLCSNLIGPGKVCRIDLPFALPLIGTAIIFGAGNIFFPISYIFGDVLTEVYGYARARKVIWTGFTAMAFATLMGWAVINLPPNPDTKFNEQIQPALKIVFGQTWRIALGSMLAFWVGDFLNSFILAKMKLLTQGKFLWMRTIGSTIVGQGADSLIFYPFAFYGIWETETLLSVVIFNWIFKVSIEVLWTPLTYLIVNTLKRAEREDYYDRSTNFTPFSLET
jgi:uncharacterized integral membrane protein (TIGR00697 family)